MLINSVDIEEPDLVMADQFLKNILKCSECS